ncbi:SDR family NAD(P)-dependent oxidoreductase [Aromatoleum anaerobium]|uniref:SDR family oxidoreductase n=1 Tax=Aromatoleum anaerobium TaxID=182180 RepID=A0ABX1PKM0_9RHOO|nr:SDR family NAD(P)-dependent oxidoreductase [Aromatoleum anaerobium]MCK0508186.1 SDR family oxidoreductase [Aromatoleum anaerobium]
MRFAGKVVVVTGAGQGMGRAIAQRFVQEGATVVAADINEAAARETLELAGRSDDTKAGIARTCNIADSGAVKALFEEVDGLYRRVDVLVNNAGIGSAKNDGFDKLLARMGERGAQMARGETPTVFPDLICDMADEGWHGVMKVNLDGTFFCTREAVRMMIKHGIKGSIINISSTAAISGEGALHYAASKAALVGMTRSLAREIAPRGIRVNNVMPGPVNTPIMQNVSQDWINSMVAGIPLGRMAEPSDIAGVVAFLASDDAAMVTGSDVVANGGSYFK